MTQAIRTAPLLLVALALVPAPGRAEAPTAYHREILRKGEGEAIVAVPFDVHVYASTREGFPDLRVYDDRGLEVPFAVEPVVRLRPVLAREEVPVEITDMGVGELGEMKVIVKLKGDAPAPDGATVHTQVRDFERNVSISGSQDGYEWTPLDVGRIYDYSSYLDLREVDIPFRPRGFRWLRLHFERDPGFWTPLSQMLTTRVQGKKRVQAEEVVKSAIRPFRIDRLELWRNVERQAVEKPVMAFVNLPVPEVVPARGPDDFRAHLPGEAKETRIDVDARGLPLAAFSLRSSTKQFHRDARVLARVDGAWVEIARTVLYRYGQGETTQKTQWTALPGRRFDRIRIVVDDGDNGPLNVLGVEGEYAEHQLVFLAEPGRTYRAAYGSDALRAPDYETAAILAGLGRDRPREIGSLGDPGANPAYRPAAPPIARFNSPIWAQLALILMAAVLLWALLLAIRRADKTPVDDFDR